MMKRRILFFASFFVVDLVLAILLGDPVLAGIILLSVFTPSYLALSLYRQKKRINLLDEACDPQAFIEACERQYVITGKNKTAHMYLIIDKSAGLASLGHFEEAKALLLSLDVKKATRHKMRALVYYNNLMLCYDGLGDGAAAKAIYENEFTNLTYKLKNYAVIRKPILFSKFKYGAAPEDIETRQFLVDEIRKLKLSKRLSLHLALYEGELAIASGDLESAKSFFNEVVTNGNKLYIVTYAQNKLNELSI